MGVLVSRVPLSPIWVRHPTPVTPIPQSPARLYDVLETKSLGQFSVFADYDMFILLADSTQVPHLSRALLTQLTSDLIAASAGAVIIGTVRRVAVPVTVNLRADEPAESEKAWDHIAEASIHTATGIIRLADVTSPSDDAPSITISPGAYRVRVYSGGFDTLSEDGLDGDDHYRLVLWPASAQPPRVVKRYPGELPGG